MRSRVFPGAIAAMACVACLSPVTLTGQSSASTVKRTSVKKTWTVPRTSEGQPDFQGVWAIATITPLERPAEFAGKEFLTEQEAAAYEKRIMAERNTDKRGATPEADLRGNYNEAWRDRGNSVVASRRTSLIVDPPDGKIPPLTPAARKKRTRQGQPAGPEDLALRIRCISRGLPMVPTPNNNFFEIVQGAGYLTILQEMMYEARMIPLDPRPHLASGIRGYMGDSRGHWEGDSLVIDTTNFIGVDDFYGADENMHLTERLTRTDADTILYQFTVNDPTAFTKPWSGEIPMRKSDEGIFDYECHEGNYSIVDILSGARAAEAKAAQGATNSEIK